MRKTKDRLEEIDADTKKIEKQIANEVRDNRYRADKRRSDHPPYHSPLPQQPRMGDRGANPNPHSRDLRPQRDPRQNNHPDRGTSNMQGRWERDKNQRPPDQNRRRDDRDSRNPAGDNDSSNLDGRWEKGKNANNSAEMGRAKRDRDQSGKQGRGSSMERDPKRARRDASPGRNPRRRR